jgi:hypothetical protein
LERHRSLHALPLRPGRCAAQAAQEVVPFAETQALIQSSSWVRWNRGGLAEVWGGDAGGVSLCKQVGAAADEQRARCAGLSPHTRAALRVSLRLTWAVNLVRCWSCLGMVDREPAVGEFDAPGSA